MFGNILVSYLVARFSEPSTWRGLVGIATAAGVAVTPDQTSAVVSVGLAVAGVVGVITRDAK